MSFDFTRLSAGEIALLGSIGLIVVAVVNWLSALSTAWVGARAARRLEHHKVVHAVKDKQARMVLRQLRVKMRYLLALRRSGQFNPAQPRADQSVVLPLFVGADRHVERLNKTANEQRAKVNSLMPSTAGPLSDEARLEVAKLIQIMGLLQHMVEINLVREAVDPAKYLWRARIEARLISRGIFPPHVR